MGSSISKEGPVFLLENSFRLVNGLLGQNTVDDEDPIWEKMKSEFILPPIAPNILDNYIYEHISTTLFETNKSSGNLRRLTWFFIKLLSSSRKDILMNLEKDMSSLLPCPTYSTLISTALLLKSIIRHYTQKFSLSNLLLHIEHDYLNFDESLDTGNINSQSTCPISKYLDKDFFDIYRTELKTLDLNYYKKFISYILSNTSGRDPFMITHNSDNSVIGELMIEICCYCICSQLYINKISESNGKNYNMIHSIYALQAIVMDILIIFFLNSTSEFSISNNISSLTKIENKTNILLPSFLDIFQILSVHLMNPSLIIQRDDSENTETIPYSFFFFLTRTTINGKKHSPTPVGIKNRSLCILSMLIFHSPLFKENVYSDFMRNILDPRFLPETSSLLIKDIQSEVDSDEDTSGITKFTYFDQICSTISSEYGLKNRILESYIFYFLIHSNSNFRLYCMSRGDPEYLIVPILEVLYILPIQKQRNVIIGTCHLIPLLTILTKLTDEPNYCKALHRTIIGSLPDWLKNSSLNKTIGMYQGQNYYSNSTYEYAISDNIVSLGSLIILTLVKLLLWNSKTHNDIFLCELACVIIQNLSSSVENFHWIVSEKTLQYCNILISQINCILSLQYDKKSEISFSNTIYCTSLTLRNLLLIVGSCLATNSKVISNIQLAYAFIRISFSNEAKKLQEMINTYFKTSSSNIQETNRFVELEFCSKYTPEFINQSPEKLKSCYFKINGIFFDIGSLLTFLETVYSKLSNFILSSEICSDDSDFQLYTFIKIIKLYLGEEEYITHSMPSCILNCPNYTFTRFEKYEGIYTKQVIWELVSNIQDKIFFCNFHKDSDA
ncbi:hypothetical protein cand_036390 [Cryptosporidium andersoni]|uniref:Dymeclin n=1 Tax=Cryptosporidium andersoni TaxID=117008 RepID=A0A1J4MX65_9CRYT|nr:hypothetical protein cand_036390 [Cryptosporidium andersoni]